MASVRARIVRMIIESFSTRPWRDSARPSLFRRILAAVSQGGEQTVAERRLQMERLTALNPAPRGTRHQKVTANGVPAAWIWSRSAASDHVVLYLHGGGYISGSIKTHRTLAAYVSRAARARVLLIDYRLAPEYPFPAAVEDAANAYRWLLAQGYPPAHLAIAGDSAGGGLTVATMLALRDSGEGLPAAGVCLSPWLDLALTGQSLTTKEGVDPMLLRSDLVFMLQHYLGSADPRTPTASPLYGDLAGLPPLLVQVGTDEILLDDACRFAERAREMGVSIELEVWDDMFHVWQMTAGFVPEAAQAVRKIGQFLRTRWGDAHA